MHVLQYISELLLRHDCVIVPDFGGFIANHVSAKIHPVTHRFMPPTKEIIFNSGLKHNDGLLANYIAQKEGITYNHAIGKIAVFVKDCQSTLTNSKKLIIEKVGIIIVDEDNNLQFNADKSINYLLSSYGLTEFISPAIRREGIEKRIEKAFAETKVFRSEHKSKNRFAKIAIISIPAAAVVVMGFLNIGTIQDVATNYSSIFNIFSTQPKAATLAAVNHKELHSDIKWQNPFDVSSQTEKTNSIIYPSFTNNTSTPEPVVKPEKDTAENTSTSTVVSACKFFIIGSCNRDKTLAEHYKSKLIEKGFTRANIIEPKNGGLYKVYIDCFDSEASAQAGLNSVQQKENSNAWLLKM
ncbi:MAG: SPOR domain-containing protein [Bacteroidota bacterium]